MKKKIIQQIEFSFVYLLFNLAKIINEKILRKFIRNIIKFLFSIIKSQRKIIFKNLEIINPNFSKDEKKKIFEKFCKVYAEIFSDQILFQKLNKERLLKKMVVKGYENAQESLSKDRGVIIVLGHLGNWEIFGSHACINGFNLNVIYRPLDNRIIDKYLTGFRTKFGLKLISKFSSPLNMIRPLLKKEILCVVADQNTIKNYIYIPFLGKIASASRGFSFFHLKTNSPVLFAYSLIDENYNQFGFIEKEYDFEKLYDELTIEEKHFLFLFNKTFNLSSKEEEYKNNLENFNKFYSIDDNFSLKEENKNSDYLKDFKNNIKKYEDLSFDEKSFYITYFFHQSLEKIIKKYPENWLLLHPRFRKQPPGFKSIYKS